MLRKSQSEILGTIILTGIILVVVSVTFLWGQPLIQKNVDKAAVNLVMEKIGEINDAITYTASTGSNNIVSLDLTGNSLLIDTLNNRIIYETFSSVPVIASTEEVPINYYELASVRENLVFNTTSTETSDPPVTGFNAATHHSNTTINGVFYNVSVYQNTTSSEWDLLCLWKDYTVSKASDCANANGNIVKEGITHTVLSILSTGNAAYANGGEIENKGVLGSEPSGIISAQSIRQVGNEKITFYLTYRTMVSPTNYEYKVVLQCDSGCSATNNKKTLVISRSNTVQSTNSTITYVKLGVQ